MRPDRRRNLSAYAIGALMALTAAAFVIGLIWLSLQ